MSDIYQKYKHNYHKHNYHKYIEESNEEFNKRVLCDFKFYLRSINKKNEIIIIGNQNITRLNNELNIIVNNT